MTLQRRRSALHAVCDITFEDVRRARYDLALFASGYEQRCTYVPEHVDVNNIDVSRVLGFAELPKAGHRPRAELYFDASWSRDRTKTSADDEGEIYSYLNGVADQRDELRILLDYSSMSRLWYAGVLTWARYRSPGKRVLIDAVYSVGEHRDSKPPMVIKDILAIPGCEGVSSEASRALAIFGLGFDKFAALCVLDRLEPNLIYAFFANPAAFEDYPDRVRQANEELLNNYASLELQISLYSVQRAYQSLAELVAPHLGKMDITLVPIGPKPHVLASVLISMRFEQICCLRVSSERTRPENITATGDVVCTRIEFVA